MLFKKFYTGLIVNKGSGWVVESIESQYVNISTYRPLSGSSYAKLPLELRIPKRGLINIKNNNQKCFLWCHVRHISSVKIHPERLMQHDKKLANDLDNDRAGFPVRVKDFSKIKTKTKIGINVFSYENKLTFPTYISNQKFENSMDLLLVTDGNILHYVYIKDFDRFMFHKTKIKTKNTFAKLVYSVLVVKMC